MTFSSFLLCSKHLKGQTHQWYIFYTKIRNGTLNQPLCCAPPLFFVLDRMIGTYVMQESTDMKNVDPRTQARLEALLEAAGIGKLSTTDGKAFADPEVLRKLTSSVSCALDEAAAALTRMRAETQPNIGANDRYI